MKLSDSDQGEWMAMASSGAVHQTKDGDWRWDALHPSCSQWDLKCGENIVIVYGVKNTDLQTVTAWPFLMPVSQESPDLSSTQLLARKIMEPASSSWLASASSDTWSESRWRVSRSVTCQAGKILLESEAVLVLLPWTGARRWWRQSALRGLNCGALAAHQTGHWNEELYWLILSLW